MIEADLSGSWKSYSPHGLWMGRDVVSQSLGLAEREISSVPWHVGTEKGEGSAPNWNHSWCSGGWSPPCWEGTLLMADETSSAVGVCCSRHTFPSCAGKKCLLLLTSLILKGGYKAEVGSNQLKLHFHSALHAKPLKALKKTLEAVQHKIALAHCSRKTNLLPGFENWKFTRLIAKLPGSGMKLEKGPCEIRAV